MSQPTYTFRVYHYVNGVGQHIWRAKERGGWFHLWTHYWLTMRVMGQPALHDEEPAEYNTREELITALRDLIVRRIRSADLDLWAKQTASLKLVLVEDVDVSP